MNNKNMVFAIVLSIASIMVAINGVSAVQAQSAFMPYGTVGNEDQPLVFYKGFYYLNVVPGGSNGMFMKLVDFDKDYSIDQAIERFGIQEDTTHFNVQPSVFSSTELVYQLDEDNQFQMIGTVE
jgi:hypothetical protein